MFTFFSLPPSPSSLSFPFPPLLSGDVCAILIYVYKTGFYCYLNTSGPTCSSQPAEQDLGAVSRPLSEEGGNRGRVAWVNGSSSSLLPQKCHLNKFSLPRMLDQECGSFILGCFQSTAPFLSFFPLILSADRAGQNVLM